MKNTKTKFAPHLHLTKLITDKFGLHVEVRHHQFDKTGFSPLGRKPIKALTEVWAFKDKQIAKDNPQNFLATAVAYCCPEDQFKRSVGLTIALRRLYRELKAQNS